MAFELSDVVVGSLVQLFITIFIGAFLLHLSSKILDFIKDVSLVKKGDKVILTQRRFAKQKGGTDSLGVITIE